MIEQFMAHNDNNRRTYALRLGDTVHLISTDESAARDLRTAGYTVERCDDPEAMGVLMVDLHPQAKGLLSGGLVRSLERLGQAMERVMLLNATEKTHAATDRLNALTVELEREKTRKWQIQPWEITPADLASIHASPTPNAGKQAPPQPGEWWREGWKGHAAPKNSHGRRDKDERNRQKAARKAQRNRK
jgi:hypothetical protein